MKKSRSKNKKRTSINRFRKNKRNTSKRKRTLKGGGKRKDIMVEMQDKNTIERNHLGQFEDSHKAIQIL